MKNYFEWKLEQLETKAELLQLKAILDRQRKEIKIRANTYVQGSARALAARKESRNLLVFSQDILNKITDIKKQTKLNNKIINEQRKGFADHFLSVASEILAYSQFNKLKTIALARSKCNTND